MAVDKVGLAQKVAAMAAGSANPKFAAAGRAIEKAAADPQAHEIGELLWVRAGQLAARLRRALDSGAAQDLTPDQRRLLDVSVAEMGAARTLATRAWLYERVFFSTAKAGTLYRHDNRVLFVSDDGVRLVDVEASAVDVVTTNPFTASLSAVFGEKRWTVSFAGPRSGSPLRDAGRLPEALRQLKSWNQLLTEPESDDQTPARDARANDHEEGTEQ